MILEDDLTGSFNTRLTPAQERAFQQWAAAHGRLGDVYDYDLRGAWLASAQQAANGHLPDTYKKPNHPTFSSDSLYSTPQHPGGTWAEQGGRWSFAPTPYNLQQYPAPQLQRYFQQNEPDATLRLPPVRRGGMFGGGR